jgi:hypothetical protein
MRNASVGVYFHPLSLEILSVTAESAAPGEPWVRFTDDYRLGLLAARRELQSLGLVEDASSVQWLGMSASDAGQQRRGSNLIREMREDSDRRHEAESKQDFLGRLVSAFVSSLRSRREEA